jgi:alpha-L-fucosidase
MKRRDFVKTCGVASAALMSPHLMLAKAPGESDADFNARMAWWREARFGMFIHWGIYAVLGLGEWAMNDLKIPEKEYEKLAPRFNPVDYDPREWVKIAKSAGMKYMVITSKHHDGFCMFKTQYTKYNIVDGTPYMRDALDMLSKACAEQGIRFGFYHSILDAHQSGINSFRKMKDQGFDKYEIYLKGQLEELLTNYGPIGSIFFDGQWIPQWNEQKGEELGKLVRSLQPKVVVNDRVGKQFESGDYNTPEQFIPKKVPDRDWETCMTINHSWGYNRLDHAWKSTTKLIQNLAIIASKGGNFLLNVGPKSNGIIPKPEMERLGEIGKWMDVNGEAIHGTTAGPLQDLSWGCTTQKPGKVFLHVFDWPQGELVVDGLANNPGKAFLLTASGRKELQSSQGGEKLTIQVPKDPAHPADSVIVLE